MRIAADFIARNAYTRLLSIIARKFGHSWLLLTFGPSVCEENHCGAIFGHYKNNGVINFLENDG